MIGIPAMDILLIETSPCYSFNQERCHTPKRNTLRYGIWLITNIDTTQRDITIEGTFKIYKTCSYNLSDMLCDNTYIILGMGSANERRYIVKGQPTSRIMMTSSNGNSFRVTGHLCGDFTGPRWIPHTRASDAELWCFLWSASE